MTFVEWADVVLPLLALCWGLCLVALHPDAIDRWMARLAARWTGNPGRVDRNRRP
jgi:hypothetical protein